MYTHPDDSACLDCAESEDVQALQLNFWIKGAGAKLQITSGRERSIDQDIVWSLCVAFVSRATQEHVWNPDASAQIPAFKVLTMPRAAPPQYSCCALADP